ncbi:conserved hypothetical protein [Talaromyces stipitatus ATCC 10500]|uniref:Uncharacterized protein n=1 Tax=Talaromyces stipitatus (strain ATCC 10500 / CBS 375.48 / QM 6759 / NRRL 1006) TaxID=441959 RepID=B8MQE9_TALSN|nr:uncharacterized protein TSTA_058390 [Talaromyces stipitatus ATCC 10500]EED13351.1 conserved hypothetical protein [Talaromyces stipitatus ATCC 10500]
MESSSISSFQHGDYAVGWISSLQLEMAAAKAMPEEIHPRLSQPQHGHNRYVLGIVGSHNVLVACLPSGIYDATSAAVVAEQIKPSGLLPNIVQYDSGKTITLGRFECTGTRNRPPQIVFTTLSNLQSNHRRGKARFHEYLCEVLENVGDTLFHCPGQESDQRIVTESRDDCRNCDSKGTGITRSTIIYCARGTLWNYRVGQPSHEAR